MSKSNILLETGTNECEILEFVVDGNNYGINVAKVREILKYQELTPIPNCHPFIEGAFSKRGETVSVINLAKCLGLKESCNALGNRLLMTSFNGITTGFHIDEVIGIKRVNWANIMKPDSMINSSSGGIVNGIVNIDDRLVLMIDFESILATITPEIAENVTHQLEHFAKNAYPKSLPILFAEDSKMIRNKIREYLETAGFTNVSDFSNGLELYNQLLVFKEDGTLNENVGCIITDLEMPQMDGHRLLKLIKEDNELKDIPVLIFSSLIDEQMASKGDGLDANGQFVKTDVQGLLNRINSIYAN